MLDVRQAALIRRDLVQHISAQGLPLKKTVFQALNEGGEEFEGEDTGETRIESPNMYCPG